MSSLEDDVQKVTDNLRLQVESGALKEAHIVSAYTDAQGLSIIQVVATSNAPAYEISLELQKEGLQVVVDQNDHTHTPDGSTHTHDGVTYTHEHDHIHY